MQIPKYLVQELQEIIRVEYGKELSMEDAEQIGSGIVSWFDNLTKLYHKNKELIDSTYDTNTKELSRI